MVLPSKLVATADRRVVCHDLRSLAEPEFERESSLKYQTRCVRVFPDGSGFAISSIEGRVAIEYFDPQMEVPPTPPSPRLHVRRIAWTWALV